MSMISDKMDVTVSYKHRRGYDDTGSPLYDEPVSIPCRIEDDRRIVKDMSGHEVVSERVLFTEREIGLNDALVLDGKDVAIIRVSRKKSVYGEYDHTEVRL